MEGLDNLSDLSREDLLTLAQSLSEQVQSLTQEVARLREQLAGQGPGQPPAFVKPNRPQKPPRERKKRPQAFARRREPPTQVCLHAASHCPDCGRALCGGWEHRRRQVIEVPPASVQVTDHVLVARWCGVCRKRVLPKLDLPEQVMGQHRVGVRLMSLIAYLKTALRLPVRQVTALLWAQWGLRLSTGEVCQVLHTLAARGAGEYARLREQVRGSPFVHADETGWREDGQNGYLWSFSTPRVRYFVYNQSRSGSVPVEVLGEAFGGVCVSDFYGGYNHVGAVRQRCWVHLLRDLHALTQAHREDPGVQAWARQVRAVYDAARAFQAQAREALARHGGAAGDLGCGAFDRRRRRREMEERLYALAEPWLRRDVPQRVLSERIERFLPELLVFVEHPDVPSGNNAAERAIRPCVIARKVSGGTRSARGSETKATLLSLFGTWQAQGQDALEACRQMLTRPAPNPAA